MFMKQRRVGTYLKNGGSERNNLRTFTPAQTMNWKAQWFPNAARSHTLIQTSSNLLPTVSFCGRHFNTSKKVKPAS
jgi:hypothetical protein